MIGSKGIMYSIKNLDFTFGGLLSGIITSVFSYNKGIFNLLSAIVFSLFVKNINDDIGTELRSETVPVHQVMERNRKRRRNPFAKIKAV